MSEALQPPLDNNAEYVPRYVHIEPLQGENGGPIPIEKFLLSREGTINMETLITSMLVEIDREEAGQGHLIHYLDKQFREASRDKKRGALRHPIAVLDQYGLAAGLGDEKRQQLFQNNPLIVKIAAYRQKALREGAEDTPILYGLIDRLLMNIVRYQALHGKYDPNDDLWHDDSRAFEYVKGNDFTLSTPQRMDPTTHFDPRQE